MRIGIGIACGALALGLGCDSRSGPITLMDGGHGADSGMMGTDGGNMGTDAGMMSGCMIPADLSALPATCLPRCSMATFNTFYMTCTTVMCQQTAAQSDTTPPVTIQGMPFGCANCVAYGQNSCAAASCPTEFMAYATCAGTPGSDCSAQTTALNGCITANMTAFQMCANMRVQSCFPG